MSSKHEICISGIGGCFPECNNIEELQKNLFEKLNLVTTTDKWTSGALGVPGQIGNIKNIHKFDSTFFGIHRWLCISLDYLTRFSVEKAYEAIIDAGVNPGELSGTQTAVIMCSCISESESMAVLDNSVGFGMLGHSRCMQANRISFALNLQGPSYNMDSSWIGGVQALKMACDMVQGGHVPAAIVGVANILNHPFISLQYTGLGKLNYSGETRSFSADAEGYNRGEACVVFFIQRVEDAKRSYGTIVSAKTCSSGVEISPYLEHTTDNLKVFLEEMYNEAGVDPSTIAYLEAEGCAIKSQDAVELNAVEQVMCKNRKDPLLIGSVKSNLGHTEAASSLVSIAKAIIALEQGVIPPNLHFSEPNPLIPGLVNGKMKVVTDATPLRGDTIGVTVHDVTCGIGHVILRQNPKSKKSLSSGATDGLPRLFVVSSRDEEGMSAILDQVSSLPVDEEFLSLTYNVWNKNIPGHLHRGYAVLPATNPPQVEHCSVSGSKRPVWFIFSGMGSQWAGMGKGLLKLPTFASAIEKCDAVLKTKGVDIYKILTTEDASVLKNILNCFLAIASIQIGLIDVLYELGIKPDGMIGHSVGELGCAYADGCITAEEMIHSTYCRGKASLEAPLIKGMMAAVGMGEKQIRKANLPESIDVACHNSSESCTLSGPAEDLEKYVAELQEKKIFARLVNVSNIAYHSRYITAVGPLLRENSKNVIAKPKLRSKKWISSSFPESKWDTDAAKYCSSEYLVNNLTSPVLFEESCKHIPDNAIIIEIAPHALLQPVLLRSLSKDTTNIALTKRGHKDGFRFFLAAVGKMYTSGLLPDIKNLYPPLEYPVSRGTKSLCNLVTWKHSENWVLNCGLDYMMRLSDSRGNKVIKINCMEDKHKIYLDHRIYNCCVLPTSAFLMFIWEKFVLMKEDSQMSKPVIFENFKLFDVVELTTTSTAVLFMMLQKGSGNWEISLGDKLLATGRIRLVDSNDNIEEEFAENRLPTYRKSPLDVCYTGSNVYNILDDSGYSHEGIFRSIKQLSVHDEGFYGEVSFKQWMSFLDGVFKMHVFHMMEKNSDVYYPSQVRQIIIDPLKFQPDSVVQVIHDKTTGITVSPGLKISDVKMDTIPVKLISGSTFTPLTIEEYKFLPYSSSHQNLNNVDEVLNVTAQLIFENFVHNKNMRTNSCKILGFGSESDFLLPKIEKILKKNPEIEIKCISSDNINEDIGNLSDLLIISDFNHLNDSCNTLNKGNGIILLHSKSKTEILHQLQPSILKVFEQNINGEKFILLKKVENIDNRKWTAIYTSNPDWSSELMSLSKSGSSGSVIYLITYGEPVNGVHEFIKTLNDRFDNQMIRLIFLLDEKCPKFLPTSLFYGKQIALDLKVNVFKNSCWGNFHKLSIKDGICNTYNSKLIQLHKLRAKELSINYLGLNLKSLTLNEQGGLLKNDLGAVEYSGTNNETGEQIMGLGSVEPNSFDLIPDPVLFWMKPSGWSLEDAATIPMAYTLAYYSLVEIGRICAGEKVLIHCGYTVIGQAAISVALRQGCEVFTTYFKSEQAEVIRNQFPLLKNHNLLLADNNFDVNLMMRTNGTGISVVVNCFGKNSNHLQNSLECLSFSGRFLHLGVNIDEITSSFGMFIFLKSVAFYGINPDNIFNHSENLKHKLKILVQKGIEDGTVIPFKYLINTGSCVNKDAIEFICSCTAENPEKKLLHCIKPEKEEIQLTKVKAKEFLCDPDKSYLIVNGKASVWVDVVSWLCQRGARNLVIAIDDQTLSSSVTRRFTKLLSQYAAAVIKLVPSTALNSIKDTKNLVSKASSLGSLDGIFFICVNDLSMIANCDNAIQMLNMKPSIFASIQSVGNNICEKRRANGFSGFSINWDESFSDPANVLLCLDEILNNSLQKNIILNDHGSNIYTERNDLSHYIPDSLKELIAYGQEIKTARFTEVQTLSLPYEQNANSSTLAFIIPSFKPKQLDKLISKLVYPTFKAQLPADICTVDEAASQLAKEIRSFKNLRALTLIASGWGGIIAILLASILEADQKAVSIILLDAEPHRVKQWASNKKGNINTILLNHYFKLDDEDQKKLSLLNNWEECLDFILKNEKINNSSSNYIRLGLTAIKNRLTAASNVKLNNIKKLKYSSIYLYEHGDSSRQFDSIKKFSETAEAIVNSETDFESMTNSATIIKSINRNVQIYYPTLETLKRSKVLQKNAEDIFGIVE